MSALLFVDDRQVPLEASEGLSQEIAQIKRGIARRLANKSLIYRSTGAKKYRTRISGGGWVSCGLSDVDFEQEVVIRCVEPLPCHSATNEVILPAGRRSDITFPAHAVVDGSLVETSITQIVSNTATLEVVAGATEYRVECYQELTVVGADFTETLNMETGKYSWTLSAEEV